MSSERNATPQDIFTRLASRYDMINAIASLGQDRRWRCEAATRLCAEDPSTVIDLCCGTGTMGKALRRVLPAARLIGVDLNPAMLAVARERTLGVYAETHMASAAAIPMADSSADSVVISLGFHDLDSPRAVLSEIRRVLRPGGSLLLLELSHPVKPRTRRTYLRLLRTLALLRDRVGLHHLGHVVDEIISTPPDDYLWHLVSEAGFLKSGQTAHGGGLMTSYLARSVKSVSTAQGRSDDRAR